MYLLSKIIWLLLSPLNLIFILIIISFLFKLFSYKNTSKIINFFIIFFFILAGILPTGNLILSNLEKKYITPDLSNKKIHGILILGGPTSPGLTNDYNQVSFNEAGERLTESVKLIKNLQPKNIIFSGGFAGHKFEKTHAYVAKKFFLDMNLDIENIIFESKSKNTYENINNSKNLANPKENEKWLIVTSAFHMTRSINVADKVDWNLIPYPVDFRIRKNFSYKPSFFKLLDNFNSFDLASHEIIGIISYYILGRTNKIF